MTLSALTGLRLAGVLVALAVLLSACGSGDGSAQETFLTEMIPHHQDAVAMADIALQRAEHPEIRELAQNIKRDQDREIQQMQRLLGNKAPKSTGGHGGGHSGSTDADKLRDAPPPVGKALSTR